MKGSPRDPAIAEEIKKIITDDAAWDAWRLRKELKARGIKGVGDNQVMRCGELAGFNVYAHYVGSAEAINKIKQKDENRVENENKPKPKSKTYKHPKGSDRIYKSMLSLDGLSWLDKESGIYGICIDDVCVYVGQSQSLLRRLVDHHYWIAHAPNESPNFELYTLLQEASKRRRDILFVVFVLLDENIGFKTKAKMLNELEAEVIHSRLPITNKAIPSADGNIEFLQRLHVDEKNINDFFNPQFIERRDFLDVDLREEYFYVYNPSYDDKIRDGLCPYSYHIEFKASQTTQN